MQTWLPMTDKHLVAGRPHHLDPSALATPSLAISCAAREALHQADVVETMLLGMLRVIKDNDLRLAEELRKLDDTVDELYSSIKYYMTRISREALGEDESQRWTDIISFTINMEQIGDIIERVIIDIEDKKIDKGRNFSEAGMAEICELHARLVDNLRLGMSVFLNGSVRDAQRLLEEKVRFRELERAYSGTHLTRLAENTVQSIETSSLHLDLISDLKRINSHICSIAYPILESAGALAPSRIKQLMPQDPSRDLEVTPGAARRLRCLVGRGGNPGSRAARRGFHPGLHGPAVVHQRIDLRRLVEHGIRAELGTAPAHVARGVVAQHDHALARAALAGGLDDVEAAALAQEQVHDSQVPGLVLRQPALALVFRFRRPCRFDQGKFLPASR